MYSRAKAMADSALSRMEGLPVSIASLGLLYCKVLMSTTHSPSHIPSTLVIHILPFSRCLTTLVTHLPCYYCYLPFLHFVLSPSPPILLFCSKNDAVVGQGGSGLNLIDMALLPLTPIVGNGTAPLQVTNEQVTPSLILRLILCLSMSYYVAYNNDILFLLPLPPLPPLAPGGDGCGGATGVPRP